MKLPEKANIYLIMAEGIKPNSTFFLGLVFHC